MKTVGEHICAWLDEIGADGLMLDGSTCLALSKDEIEEAYHVFPELVPAFRHADGSYHTEKETSDPCPVCEGVLCEVFSEECPRNSEYQSLLAHKEATK